MIQKIAAVVLTFNRVASLAQCIALLRQQTRPPDAIIVVNNGSTDGSRDWLDAQPDLVVVHQANRAPSGGFGRGLETAVALGFDWAWCLDDDAYATPCALQELCKAMGARPDARMFNSLGVDASNHERFAVGALWVRTNPTNYLSGRGVVTRTELAGYVDADGLVDSLGGHFYQGVLFHRSVVETVGLPSLQIYMRGEEVEYGLRIMRAGYHIYAVVNSIVYHPQMPFVTLRVLGKTKDLMILNATKRYFTIRNSVWIRKIYFKDSAWRYALRRVAGALLTDLFLAPNMPLRERVASARSVLRGAWDGLRLPLPTDTDAPIPIPTEVGLTA